MTSMLERPPKSAASKQAYEMEKTMLYHRIIDSNYRSAFHISEIVFNETTPAERNAIIYEPRVEKPKTLSGKGPLPRDRVTQWPAAPKLAKVLPQARMRWVEYLRDRQLRDIDVVFQGNSTQCRGRLTMMKEKMSRAGGRPYHMHKYDESTRTMCFSIVIAHDALNGLSTPEMIEDFQMQIIDNIDPDLSNGTTEASTTPAGTTPVQQNGVAMSAKRRGKQVKFCDPPTQSWYPIPSSEMKQPEWSQSDVDFTREYSDNHVTDDDWWLRDLLVRTQMIADWQENRTPRRLAMAFGDDPTTLAPIDPEVMPGLCDTYGANVSQAKREEQNIQLLRVLFTEFVYSKAKYERAEQSYRSDRSRYRRVRAHPQASAHPNFITCWLYCHDFHDIKLDHDSLEKRFHTACKDVPRHLIHNDQIKDAALLAELREVHQIKVVATPFPGNNTIVNGKIFLPCYAELAGENAKGARESPEQQEHDQEHDHTPDPPQELFVTLSSPDASAHSTLKTVATASGVQQKTWSPLGLIRQVLYGMLKLPSLFSVGNGSPAAA
ncbi:hypothetical protein HII31_08440 [Pseudocercospora fuligena]|uniref:Uncharacterized protein n=1 Tax=Pseudocercospora fuligena TaxID=685502 RepID=A0A8H6VJB3_9PEZI|nr:hypothetical protein HII31_08440 [Pseudocercospora fuligena]